MQNGINLFYFKILIIVCLAIFGCYGCSSETKNNTNQTVEISPEQNQTHPLQNSVNKKVVYIVSDMNIPFWQIMSRGVTQKANELGYEIEILSSNNNLKTELQAVAKAINEQVAGIIVSPTNSSSCVTILNLAKEANIPVVISDIGTDAGEYVAYISSDNEMGGYGIGGVLAKELVKRNWQNGKTAIIAIPQQRINGQARTNGFLKALAKAGIKNVDIREQVDFSYEETYRFSKELIQKYPDLRALWLEGSNRYQGALDAIADSNKKGEIILATFDAEPEYLKLIPQGVIVASAMQQPYLMGANAVEKLIDYINGKKTDKIVKLPVLIVTPENINENLPQIQKNVLGIVEKVK